MNGRPHGWLRRVAWLVGAMVAVAVLLAVLAPLVLRGRVLRWTVGRATRSLCGGFELEGGHFGFGLVPDLLLGRPVSVELEGLRLTSPDGSEALAVAHFAARVGIFRHPWRAAVDDVVVSHGRWRLAMGGPPGSGFVDAFRPVPAGGSRDACVAPRPPTAARVRPAATPAARVGTPPTSFAGRLVVRSARIDDVDVTLDFPVWGLQLPHVQATGSLEVGAANGSPFLFQVHDVVAPGGVLRVGRPESAGVTRERFDDVALTSVVLSQERPGDIVLEVGHARTGRLSLHGKAAFEHVIPAPGRLPRRPPGMTLDARWDDADDALARLEAGWLPTDATFAGVGLGGTFAGRLQGPFQALSGTVSVDGPRAHLAVTLEEGTRAVVDASATRLNLTPLLGEELRGPLGGTVAGRLRARAVLAARPSDLEVSISQADLTLARAARAGGPRTLALHVGAARARPDLSGRDALELDLATARFARGDLRLEALRARWADGSLRGNVVILGGGPPAPSARRPVRVEATLEFQVLSLERLVPSEDVAGQLAATAHVSGTPDHLAVRFDFAPSTWVALLGQRFHAPRTLTATIEGGHTLTLARATFPHDGGGGLTAEGHVDLPGAGAIEGQLTLAGYPLAAVPGLPQVRLPGMLVVRPNTTLADALTGRVDAMLRARGALRRPLLDGTVRVTGVVFAGRTIGNGHFEAKTRGNTLTLEGTMGPSLSLVAHARRSRAGITATSTTDLRALELGPWLPPPLRGLDLRATGRGTVTVLPHVPLSVGGAFRFEGSGADLAVEGALRAGDISGRLRGPVELGPLRRLWSRWLAEADGALELDLSGDSAAAAPFSGTLRATRPLTVRPKGWPLAVQIAEGGRVELDGARVRTPGLVVTADGARVEVSGEAVIDAAAPARSRVSLAARARVDAASLVRRLRPRALASASGTITVDAHAVGEAASPEVTGQARLDDVALVPTAAGWPALRVGGVVEATDHELRTRGLTVRTGAAGVLTVGAATAPATVEIRSWSPLGIGQLDVPIVGRGLRFGDARSAFQVGRLDLSLRVAGSPRSTVTVAGDVGLAQTRFDTGHKGPAKAGPSRPWYQALPPHLALDLVLHGPDDAVTVAVPGPDVRVGFDCHVQASARGAKLDGRIRGGTVYSRAAIALYDWFSPLDVRRCRVLKE